MLGLLVSKNSVWLVSSKLRIEDDRISWGVGLMGIVVKANAIRTWDIGDMEYSLVKEFLDTLPAEQLAAIEEASPVSWRFPV